MEIFVIFVLSMAIVYLGMSRFYWKNKYYVKCISDEEIISNLKSKLEIANKRLDNQNSRFEKHFQETKNFIISKN